VTNKIDFGITQPSVFISRILLRKEVNKIDFGITQTCFYIYNVKKISNDEFIYVILNIVEIIKIHT